MIAEELRDDGWIRLSSELDTYAGYLNYSVETAVRAQPPQQWHTRSVGHVFVARRKPCATLLRATGLVCTNVGNACSSPAAVCVRMRHGMRRLHAGRLPLGPLQPRCTPLDPIF